MSSELGFRIGVGFGLYCFFFFLFYLFFSTYLFIFWQGVGFRIGGIFFLSLVLSLSDTTPFLGFFLFSHSHHFFLCLNSYLSCHAICYREEKGMDWMDWMDGIMGGRDLNEMKNCYVLITFSSL